MKKIRKGNVPNKEIREAFLRSGLTSAQVAAFCGWMRGKSPRPDTTRVERALGLKTTISGTGRVTINRSVSYDNAIKLIQAMNYDPVDFRDIGL
jgi:hypothetical protein